MGKLSSVTRTRLAKSPLPPRCTSNFIWLNKAALVATLHKQIRAKVGPPEGEKQGGLLVVPEVLTVEEWTVQAERHNAVAQDPTDYVDHKVEEFCKAVQGIRTPLGEAILASHRRWNKLNSH